MQVFDIRRGSGPSKAAIWNQTAGKPEDTFQKYGHGNRKQNRNNKIGSATSKRKPLYQDIHEHACGNPSIKMARLGSRFQAGDSNYMVADAL